MDKLTKGYKSNRTFSEPNLDLSPGVVCHINPAGEAERVVKYMAKPVTLWEALAVLPTQGQGAETERMVVADELSLQEGFQGEKVVVGMSKSSHQEKKQCWGHNLFHF